MLRHKLSLLDTTHMIYSRSCDPAPNLLSRFRQNMLPQVLISIAAALPLELIHRIGDHEREQDGRLLCDMEGRRPKESLILILLSLHLH